MHGPHLAGQKLTKAQRVVVRKIVSGKRYKDIRRIGYGLGEVSIVIMQNMTVVSDI